LYERTERNRHIQTGPFSMSTQISKAYQNIIIFKWCGSSLKNQEISAGIFRYLRVSSNICGHLYTSVGIFRYHPHINKILTCHMEYTESLPAPPSTHEAWPTKPRSVSHWPDWKVGRLSAGRPGRLRTLPPLPMHALLYPPILLAGHLCES